MITSRELTSFEKSKKLIIGSSTVIKRAKKGEIQKVVKASNCPENLKNDLLQYSKLSKFEIEDFPGDSKQLGEMCGKPFNILMVGIKK